MEIILGISFIAFAIYKLTAKPKEVLIITVIDGDTVVAVDNSGKRFKIRLMDMDAPELDQDFGIESKEYLESLVKDKWVRIKFRGKDVYDRYLAYLYVDKKNVSDLMVKEGLAFTLKSISFNQMSARINKRGVWISMFPQKPWNSKSRRIKQR